MKSKLKIIVPVLLIALGGVYKFVLAKPAATAKPKVDGEVYVMPKDFLINLADGRFAKLDVGFVFRHGFAAAPVDLGEFDRLTAVVVELAVEVGRTRMSLGQAMALGPGSVVTLDRMADQPV